MESSMRRGKGFSRSELQSAGIAPSDAKRLGVLVDKRRRSAHRINIDALKEANDHG